MTLFATTTRTVGPEALPMSRGKFGPHAEQGGVLKTRRTALKLSQGEVAHRYGSSQSYISSVERGWEGITTASLDWVMRYAAALDWAPEEMMEALGIEYAKANKPITVTSSGNYVPAQNQILHSATVEIQIMETGGGDQRVQLKKIVVSQENLVADDLRGLRMSQGYLNALPIGMIALYSPARSEAREGDLVAVEVQGERHVGYMIAGGQIETDRPISPTIPLRFSPDAILGTVVQRVDDCAPRRLN